MANKTHRDWLLDSALLISIVSAACYIQGFLHQMRPALRSLIPWDLMPIAPVHQTLVVGFIYLFIYFAIGVGVYLVYILLAKRRFIIADTISRYVRKRHEEYGLGFYLFVATIAGILFIIIPIFWQAP
jgi:hypothetical protein